MFESGQSFFCFVANRSRCTNDVSITSSSSSTSTIDEEKLCGSLLFKFSLELQLSLLHPFLIGRRQGLLSLLFLFVPGWKGKYIERARASTHGTISRRVAQRIASFGSSTSAGGALFIRVVPTP